MSKSEIAGESSANINGVSGVVKVWKSLRAKADDLDAKAAQVAAEGDRRKASSYRLSAERYRVAAGKSPRAYFDRWRHSAEEYERSAAVSAAAGDCHHAAFVKSLAQSSRAAACGFNLHGARDAYEKTAARVSIGLNTGMVALLGRLGVPKASWSKALSVLLEEALCAVEDSGQPVASDSDPSRTRILHKLTAGPEIYAGTRRMAHRDRHVAEPLALEFLFAQVEFGEASSLDSE